MLDKSRQNISEDESSRLFAGCAADCTKDALQYLYTDLFDESGGDPDLFSAGFMRLTVWTAVPLKRGKRLTLFLEIAIVRFTPGHISAAPNSARVPGRASDVLTAHLPHNEAGKRKAGFFRYIRYRKSIRRYPVYAKGKEADLKKVIFSERDSCYENRE